MHADLPDVAYELLDACDRYLSGETQLATVKAAVWSAAQQIVAVQEREVRDFLQAAESRLDLVEHTTGDEYVYAAAAAVLVEVKARLADYLSA